MQKVKYFLGAAALLLALWVIIGEQITGASSNAVVNAKIIILRAPISGFAQIKPMALGEAIPSETELVKIENPLYDFSNLYNLERDERDQNNNIFKINKILEITNSEIADMQTYLDKQRDFAIFENGRNITRSEARIRLFEEIEYVLVSIKGDKLSARSVQNSIELSRAKENVEIQREIRRNLLNNFFVGEGLGSILESQNKIRDRTVSRSNLLRELSLSKSKLINIKTRIDREEALVQLFSKAIVKNNIKALLWETLVSDGEPIERGQELFRLLDCSSAMVTLSVSSSVYNNLKIGQKAIFFPDNTDLKYDGKIGRLAGSGASRIYKNLAIPPSIKNEERFDVLINVPKLADKVIESCIIGQTGRIFFDKRPFDWFRDLIFK